MTQAPITSTGVVASAGSLDRWFAYRVTAGGAVPGDAIGIGDSTMYGSQGNCTFLQQLRDRAVTAGVADGGKGMFGQGKKLIAYDTSEINGFVSETWAGAPDGYDNLDGQYFYDNGAAPTAPSSCNCGPPAPACGTPSAATQATSPAPSPTPAAPSSHPAPSTPGPPAATSRTTSSTCPV